MERITLSIPTEMRETLRQLARSQDRREAELLRELLGRALAEAQRDAIYRAVEDAMTPEAARHLTALSERMEALRGEPR